MSELPERCCARCGFSACNPSWLKEPDHVRPFQQRVHVDMLGARATTTCYRIAFQIVYARDRCPMWEAIDDVEVVDGQFRVRGKPINGAWPL